MELRHLTYFVAVAERLSFSRAAEALQVAQPAISQQIRALERDLGMPLFERVGKRVALTDAGQAFLPHARHILASVANAQHEMRQRGSLLRGRASLGAPPTISAHILPKRLTAFERTYPGLEVTLREAGTETLINLVTMGELDLAIVSSSVLPPSVESQPYLAEGYVLAVSAEHVSSKRRRIKLTELAEEPFILFPDGYKLRHVTLEACRRAGFEPKVALDGGSMQSALQFVAAGLGVALVPELALTDARGICAVQIADQKLTRELGLVWRRGRTLSPAAGALREFLMGE